MRRVGAGEHQVTPDAVPHDEAWIGRERLVHKIHRVGVVFQVVLHGAIEQRGGLFTVGGEMQTACVADHSLFPVCWTFGR
jgi:hypothetical protein